jgi:hypothetical protein
MPSGWELHRAVFSLTRQDNEEWSTHVSGYTHLHRVVYPNFVSGRPGDIFDDGEDDYVKKLAVYSRDSGYRRIECSCGAFIPSTRGNERDIIQCHPSFHSYPYLKRPWHDWAMVKWLYEDHDDTEEYVHVAARSSFFARLSENEQIFKPPKIVAVIHSLSKFLPPQDPLLFFAKGDTLDEGGIDVVEASAIEETAFVLPCVQEMGDEFPISHQTSKYFLVFPPRSDWTSIWYGGDDDAAD